MAETKGRERTCVPSALVAFGIAGALIALWFAVPGGRPPFVAPPADARLLQRIVPGFCTDRFPSSGTLDLLGAALQTSYPRSPEDVVTNINVDGKPVTFHPLLALVLSCASQRNDG
jgi:hypothetical protein